MCAVPIEFDVLVIGSGAAGLTCGVTASKCGLKTLVVEKAPVFGGTTAISAGFFWIPCNAPAERAGIANSIDGARRYLRSEIVNFYDEALIDCFLNNGPRMIEFLENELDIPFQVAANIADYHPDVPGASTGGRIVCVPPVHGRLLGELISKLRPPLPEHTLFGLRIGGGAVELTHFLNATRSLASAKYVMRRLCSYAYNRLRYGQDMRLVNGAALAARLAKALINWSGTIWVDSPALELDLDDGRVVGAVIQKGQDKIKVLARRGIVLATGGFPQDMVRRRLLYAHKPSNSEHFSVAPSENTGDGLKLAESVGGMIQDGYANAAAWYPISLIPKSNGGFRVFPHSIDRGKPGVIAVTPSGERFVNESDSYFDFTLAMLKTREIGLPGTAFLVCDHRALRRYGLGAVKPFPFPMNAFLRSGYLLRGNTLEELAARAQIPPVALKMTVAIFNKYADTGQDPLFRRGTNVFNKSQGDTDNRPNPCLAPLERPPYYAIKILPGDLGTFSGIKTNSRGQVVNRSGAPIKGLYAVGNDMASIFGGMYPAGGITLGPAMTFGYVVGRDLASCKSAD